MAIVCIVLVARTLTRLTGAILRSQDVHLAAQVVEVLAIPGAVALMLLIGLIRSLDEVLWATALSGIASAAYGLFRASRHVSGSARSLDIPFRLLFNSSLPLWLTAIALNIADWYSLATAATVLSVYDAGLFRVAFQIGGALSFVAMGMYNVFTARISAAVAAGDVYRVARLGRAATRLALLLIVLPCIVLLLFADPLLSLIGTKFREAVPILRIVVIGQTLYVATGPAGFVLAMTGHERMNLLTSMSVTVLLLLSAPVIAHHNGLLGLAIVSGAVPFLGNLANLFLVRRLEKINVITGTYFGGEAAA